MVDFLVDLLYFLSGALLLIMFSMLIHSQLNQLVTGRTKYQIKKGIQRKEKATLRSSVERILGKRWLFVFILPSVYSDIPKDADWRQQRWLNLTLFCNYFYNSVIDIIFIDNSVIDVSFMSITFNMWISKSTYASFYLRLWGVAPCGAVVVIL